MTKTAKPLYTDPEDIQAYEDRKRFRRNMLTAAGGLFGGYAGGVVGGGIGVASGSGARRAILHALVGAGLGAGAGALGMRKLVDFRHNYMESAGLDGTIPALRATVTPYGVKKAAEAGDDTVTRAIGNARLEKLGPWVSALTAGGVGRGLGKLGRRKWLGTLAGLAVGGAVNGGGKLVAHVTPARTGAAQAAHDAKLHLLKSLLLPGYGSYNGVKRQEREQIRPWH